MYKYHALSKLIWLNFPHQLNKICECTMYAYWNSKYFFKVKWICTTEIRAIQIKYTCYSRKVFKTFLWVYPSKIYASKYSIQLGEVTVKILSFTFLPWTICVNGIVLLTPQGCWCKDCELLTIFYYMYSQKHFSSVKV